MDIRTIIATMVITYMGQDMAQDPLDHLPLSSVVFHRLLRIIQIINHQEVVNRIIRTAVQFKDNLAVNFTNMGVVFIEDNRNIPTP